MCAMDSEPHGTKFTGSKEEMQQVNETQTPALEKKTM